MKNRIGIVAMPDISTGGGFPKVVRDLINGLDELGKEVYFLSPFKLNLEKIAKFYGPIKITKAYHFDGLRLKLSRENIIARKLIKNQFQKLIKEVDLVIDMDGKVLHKYIPKGHESKYIIWRVSPARTDLDKFPDLPRSLKRKIKDFIIKIINIKKPLPSKNHKIYTLDNYTANELRKYWKLNPKQHHLYPEVLTNKLIYNPKKKKNQIIISGRIIMCKRLDDSIKVFAKGIMGFPDYKLVIIGGAGRDAEDYIKYLKQVAEEFGVSKKVTFIKNPPYEKIKKTLMESKVLIDSEQGESTTITTIEALASGVIALVSTKDNGTWWEMLENGKWGFGFDNVDEGGKKLNMILKKLEDQELDPIKFMKRVDFYSHKNFIKRVKKILKDNGVL